MASFFSVLISYFFVCLFEILGANMRRSVRSRVETVSLRKGSFRSPFYRVEDLNLECNFGKKKPKQ